MLNFYLTSISSEEEKDLIKKIIRFYDGKVNFVNDEIASIYPNNKFNRLGFTQTLKSLGYNIIKVESVE